MTVLIAPNIKRERDVINQNGDVIDLKTKRVIKKKDAEPIVIPIPAPKSNLADKIEQKINEKIEQIIDQRIEEVLKRL